MTRDREDTQATPDGTALTLPHLVKWVEMAVRARTERALRDLPVSGTQLFVLVLLRERGEATSADLARMMHITPQAMTTLIGPLRDGGYIDRRVDTTHARRLLLRLTPDGAAMIRQARSLTPAIEDDLLDGFTDEERVVLKKLLGRIARRFE
ncbi:MarR family transcriptional regulator [Altererythrobacter xixiisoli]|uniref:MarR family transcriptional regulator n=1 Tax=Croceibacterium xixiisoli TaxID=1476466 RepID=A0A6I4TXL1_9SPHN|nr:MarR family transcriptional regulator [Croceibacterium xixiisoli]MXP00663.1 MarR family transcriptional regulator [Croceibacterium xixiisoli]